MKEILINYLTYILNKLKGKPLNSINSISSLAPKTLTEKKDLDRIYPYTKRLKDAIDQKGITNIALTGGYGSGKSTILNTFQNILYPEDYKYINISLASFKDNKENKSEQNENLERQLEISILQQIFYHVKPSRIPDSRFKRIINLTNGKLFGFSLLLIIWIFCTLILFKFGYVEHLNPSTWHLSQKIDWATLCFTLLSTICFFIGIGLFSRMLTRLFINSKINKLNIKGEVELGTDIDKSVFNEHLEEILYFFERTDYNVVIIEDLDRFDDTDIFTKLREINIILNKSELLQDREINFIYAIRDEMFIDKSERVKFFEYIIPVIPFINPSNAGEQIAKFIKEYKLENILSTEFTEDVVTFIDDIDMRLLTNIFHEYILYKESLKELNQNSLFAIITYKNIFPDDFGKLHKREGHLYKLLSNKDEYIKQITVEYKKNIIERELEIKNIQKETIGNIVELRTVYINAILKKTPGISSFLVNNIQVNFSQIIEDEYFLVLLKSTNIIYQHYYEYNRGYYTINRDSTNYSFESIQNEVNEEFTYLEREEFIKKRNKGEIDKLKEEITKLKNKISSIESKSLTEIFREVKIDNFIKGKPIDIPLVRNLLLNGYINENYNDYISIFHGINMTPQDFAFIRKVKSGTQEIFNYQLTNIAQIVKKLQIRYFQHEAILNFDLFEYLLENNTKHTKQYESILELIKKETENSLEFMDGYIYKSRKQIPLFIQKLSNIWSNFWIFIYEHPTYEDKKKDHYLFLILVHANLDSIYSLNKDLKLANYIENHTRFISLFTDKDHLNKITSVINKLDILLEKLELPDETNENLFQYIYENNHYYINIHNITLLLNKLCTGNSEGIVCWNYTTILKSNCEPIKNYIQNNLEEYLENVFLKLPNNNNESEDSILRLLNNNDLPIELRSKIIDKQITQITDNSRSEYLEIDTLLFQKNKMKATWDNIIRYFNELEEKVIDDALIAFLNIKENYKVLNDQNIEKKAEEIKDLETQLIYSNQLSIEAYKSLVIKTPHKWNSFNFSSLDSNKVEWLIHNKLNLTKYNFDKLKHDFISLSIKLLEKYSHQLLEKYDELELDIDDHIEILESKVIDQSIKEDLIPKIENRWILENDKLKMLIKNILYKSNEAPLDYGVLESIVRYSKNNDKRLHLIYNHIGGLDNEQIKTLVKILGGNYKEIFESRKQKEFSYSILKENIFKLLKEKGMINSYKINENKTKIKVVALYKE